MALIQWKQISPHFSGSGNLTGSLNVLGDITVNGQQVAVASVSGAYATLDGGNNFTGDQNITGDLNVVGDLTATRFFTQLTTSSIIYESGSTKFGDSFNDTHQFTGSIQHSGSYLHHGNIIGTGSLVFTGSLINSGTAEFVSYPWPEVNEEYHFLKTEPYSIVFNGISRSYDYHGIALEHLNDPSNYYHNSLLLYTFNDHETPDFGGELNIGPIRSHLRQRVSGSTSLANVSVQELTNGKSQTLVYGDYLELGAFRGEKINIGNTGSAIHVSGSLDLLLNGVNQYFSINIGSASQFKINDEGVMQLGLKSNTPTAITGGMYYSSSDEYYLGFLS